MHPCKESNQFKCLKMDVNKWSPATDTMLRDRLSAVRGIVAAIKPVLSWYQLRCCISWEICTYLSSPTADCQQERISIKGFVNSNVKSNYMLVLLILLMTLCSRYLKHGSPWVDTCRGSSSRSPRTPAGRRSCRSPPWPPWSSPRPPALSSTKQL